jgi:uncharacterized RDD family membrane protein YckC
MQLTIAAPFKRVLAFIIDLLLIIPLITAFILISNSLLDLPVTPEFTIKGFEIKMDSWAKGHFWEVVIMYSMVKLIVISFYYIPFEASAWQGTPGKRLMKIKVTDLEGQQISFKKSAVRFFSKILSAQLLIGYIMILITDKKQGLHDLIAETLVQESLPNTQWQPYKTTR